VKSRALGDMRHLLSGLAVSVLAFAAFLTGCGDGVASNEQKVGSALMAYASAQTMYKRQDWDSDGEREYATPFSLLREQKDADGNRIELIPAEIAAAKSGGTPRNGYVFKDVVTIGGRPVDWTTTYALCAAPVKYGSSGKHVIVMVDGTLWARDMGKSVFVTAFPADPAKAGWTKW
jgi:Protein of unknown function (DUF2950)